MLFFSLGILFVCENFGHKFDRHYIWSLEKKWEHLIEQRADLHVYMVQALIDFSYYLITTVFFQRQKKPTLKSD